MGGSGTRKSASALQVVLKNVSEKQTEDYRDLRGRFDAFATGLTQEQMTTKAQLGYLLEQTRSTSPGSVHPSPAIETKGDENEPGIQPRRTLEAAPADRPGGCR